jgi:hypothetical protein
VVGSKRGKEGVQAQIYRGESEHWVIADLGNAAMHQPEKNQTALTPTIGHAGELDLMLLA